MYCNNRNIIIRFGNAVCGNVIPYCDLGSLVVVMYAITIVSTCDFCALPDQLSHIVVLVDFHIGKPDC